MLNTAGWTALTTLRRCAISEKRSNVLAVHFASWLVYLYGVGQSEMSRMCWISELRPQTVLSCAFTSKHRRCKLSRLPRQIALDNNLSFTRKHRISNNDYNFSLRYTFFPRSSQNDSSGRHLIFSKKTYLQNLYIQEYCYKSRSLRR